MLSQYWKTQHFNKVLKSNSYFGDANNIFVDRMLSFYTQLYNLLVQSKHSVVVAERKKMLLNYLAPLIDNVNYVVGFFSLKLEICLMCRELLAFKYVFIVFSKQIGCFFYVCTSEILKSRVHDTNLYFYR